MKLTNKEKEVLRDILMMWYLTDADWWYEGIRLKDLWEKLK